MNRVKSKVKSLLGKYGAAVAACAFAFVFVSANSPCAGPFYEPEEPEGLNRFKKMDLM